MRTLILIAIGLAIAAIVLWRAPAARRSLAAVVFSVLWLCVCMWNLRTGMSHGYTLAQELPIHAVLFGVPVIGAWALRFRLARGH
jgi:hypothetical protein